MNVEALAKFLSKSAQRQFVLGKFDCVSFTFEGVRVGWNRDYLKFLEYDDRRSAVDRLRASDGLYDAICEGCKKIKHINLGQIDFIQKKIKGSICHFQIDVTGLCENCQK